MILSNAHRFIFVHMPKTAGTSIREHLYEVAPDTVAASAPFNKLGDSVHSPASKLKRRLGSIWDDYFKFAFVRNPWDLVVSMYFYNAVVCADSPDEEDRRRNHALLKRYPSVQSFLKSNFRLGSPLIRDAQYYLFDAAGKCLVDYVGKFEDLSASYDQIAARVGLPTATLPHHNPTPHVHYSAYYDQEAVDNVARRFRKDIELFGYAFDRQLDPIELEEIPLPLEAPAPRPLIPAVLRKLGIRSPVEV